MPDSLNPDSLNPDSLNPQDAPTPFNLGLIKFTAMKDGDAEDYALIGRLEEAHNATFPARLIQQLKSIGGDAFGYHVDRYAHSLQSATLAFRAGEDEETVVAALFHDIGDAFAPHNHSQAAAAILAPYVGEKNLWVVRHHGLFQGYYYFHHQGKDRDARDRYRDHPHFQACADFCERYDQPAFDPNFDTMPMEAFEPMVWRILGKPRDPAV